MQVVAGISKLCVSVGVHQESAISSLLFVLVIDTNVQDIQRPVIYTGDVSLASHSKSEIEKLVQK